MDPQERDRENKSRAENAERDEKERTEKFAATAEKFFFLVHHALADFHEFRGGGDIFAAETELGAVVEWAQFADFDGSVEELDAAQDVVVELHAHSGLAWIVFNQIADLSHILVNLALVAFIGSEGGFIAGIQKSCVGAGGVGKRGLEVAESDLNFVTVCRPLGRVDEASDGNGGGDGAAEKQNQSRQKCQSRLFS